MKYVPHDYQRQAITFIKNHPAAAVFLGLGMGKTIITLTALNDMMFNSFTACRALIIAPLRVARDTWPAEIQKWDHLQRLTVSVIVGDAKTRKEALATPADIHIINRENIPWLVSQLPKGAWPWDTVVIDELSSFKNHKAKRFKALFKQRPHIRRIIGLTGTPAPNSLEDLWAPYKLLDGGQRLFKNLTNFRATWFTPGRRNGHVIYEWNIKKGAEEEIYSRIRDITLSMKTTDYLTLPPLTTSTNTVTLDETALANYRKLKQEMVLRLDTATVDAANAATLSSKLQQLASGAIYINDDHDWLPVHDAKLQVLDEIIEAANGNTVLVAYWFKHELDRLQDRYPHGRQLKTSEDIQDWCNGDIPLAFIHSASAGHGLNLQSGGHILVWLTTPWSLELYEQTNARLFRQGQTEPVSIIHIACGGTVDEQVLKALDRKDVTQSSLIDAVKAQLTETLKRKEAA